MIRNRIAGETDGAEPIITWNVKTSFGCVLLVGTDGATGRSETVLEITEEGELDRYMTDLPGIEKTPGGFIRLAADRTTTEEIKAEDQPEVIPEKPVRTRKHRWEEKLNTINDYDAIEVIHVVEGVETVYGYKNLTPMFLKMMRKKKNCRSLRDAKGLSYSLGVSDTCVSNYVAGALVRLDVAKQIAELYGVSLEEFLCLGFDHGVTRKPDTETAAE